MTVRGTMSLPFQVGALSVFADGTVEITGKDKLMVYPYAQPQPYYTINPGSPNEKHCTTDGARLLFQAVMEAATPLRVHAGYYLMAALLISPEGLVLPDLDPDTLLYRRDAQSYTIVVGDQGRWGLKPESEVAFCDSTHHNRLGFDPITEDASWGNTPLPNPHAWRTHGPANEDAWRG